MDKLKKIVYIVSGTLSIMLMVFLLMHKVGLCASGGSSGSDSQVYVDSIAPIPYGNHLGYASDVTFNVDFYDRIRTEFLSVFPNASNIYCSIYEETTDESIVFCVFNLNLNKTGDNWTWHESNSSKKFYFAKSSYDGRYITYDIVNDSFSISSGSPNDFNVYVTNLITQNPAYPTSGLEWVVTKGVYKYRYPVFYYSGGEYTTLNSNYGEYSGGMVFPLVESGSVDTGFNTDDFEFSSYSDLPDSPSSGDSNYSLYQWLNGQNKNNYDYTKSTFDLLKGFISWVVAPIDTGVLQDSWEGTDLGGIVTYVSGLGNTLKSLFGNGASVPETLSFNCSITLLGQTFPYTVDFSWYQQIKTPFLTVFLTFFYAGAFLYFIKSIPSFVNGVSGTMNNFTQAGGGSDD